MKKQTHIEPIEEAYRLLREKLETVSKICHVPVSDAEDLIHDGYIRLVNQDLPTVVEARGKLWTTIRNLSIDNFRRNSKAVSLERCVLDDIEHYDHHTLDYDALSKQMEELLTPLQFKIMKMLVTDQMDYTEIAQVLDMTESAVRAHVSRARKLLKEKMDL